MRGYGVGLRLLGAVAAFVVTFAASAVYAQSATTTPVGKPLALLAGLRPPQDIKHATRHKATRHFVHDAHAHAKAAHEKTAERHRGRMTAHARHATVAGLAARHHAHHEQTVTASAFADAPPQAASAPPPAPAPNWSVVNAAAPSDEFAPPAADAAAPAVSTNANAGAASAYQNPDASKVQTIKITAANPAGLPDPAAAPVASATAPTTDAAAAQTVLAASAEQAATDEPTGKTMATIGSASWIAQVLAALGGAVAAGALAWFLIGGGPVRTYG